MMKEPVSLERKIALFSRAAVFKGLSNNAQKKLAELAVSIQYVKNDIVFQSQEPCATSQFN